MTDKPEFSWQGKRVFLTGHTGFKGGWLALWLGKLGAQVRGYALDPATDPNLFTVARVGSRGGRCTRRHPRRLHAGGCDARLCA